MLAEIPETQRSPCNSAVSASLTNPLPDCSNYSPFCHTHYLILRMNTSLVSRARPFTKPLCWRLILHSCSVLVQNLVGNSSSEEYCSALRKLNDKQRQVVMFLLFNCHLNSLMSLFLFSLSLSSLCSLSQWSLFSLSSFPLASPPSLLSHLINSLSS